MNPNCNNKSEHGVDPFHVCEEKTEKEMQGDIDVCSKHYQEDCNDCFYTTPPTEEGWERFWKAFEGAQIVRSTNSVTGEVETYPNAIEDQEETIVIHGQFDAQTIRDALASQRKEAYEEGKKEGKVIGCNRIYEEAHFQLLQELREKVENEINAELIYADKELASSGEMGARNVVLKRLKQNIFDRLSLRDDEGSTYAFES